VRFILFLPEEVTDKTTSTLLPQMLQRCILLFASARAPTSVFDFPFSAISIPPFFCQFKCLKIVCPVNRSGTHPPVPSFPDGLVLLAQVKTCQEIKTFNYNKK